MNRRNFINFIGCSCISLSLQSCTTAPITDRKQLKLLPEAKLNAQAAQIYEKVKKKEKLVINSKELDEIKEIGKKIQYSITSYFESSNLEDPTINFDWEYILIENKKIKNAWCMPGGKIAVYTGILDITKNINGLVGRNCIQQSKTVKFNLVKAKLYHQIVPSTSLPCRWEFCLFC